MPDRDLLETLYRSIDVKPHDLWGNPGIARIEIHGNRVLGVHLLPGLEVDASEKDEGIEALIRVKRGTVIEQPVQVCFGMVPERGRQRIDLNIEVEEDASAGILAHCTFPNAVEILHEMNANLTIGPGAKYAYVERHVHGPDGGVIVVPKSLVRVLEGATYSTDFEIIRGRAGKIDIDVHVIAERHAVADVSARVLGSKDDRITIHEAIDLVGEYARGVLTSNIALRDDARAEIYNSLVATAPYARGHVDCKEIVQDRAVAKAVPIVEVKDPRAHVTHEAAIGSVDSKQLETLMSRGLTEDEAVDLIIQGLLHR